MIHILVVDDDEKLNRTICKWLNDVGFEAKGALNAKDAFEEMYNSLYDLIISDIMMPEMDGFAFAEKVSQSQKSGIKNHRNRRHRRPQPGMAERPGTDKQPHP